MIIKELDLGDIQYTLYSLVEEALRCGGIMPDENKIISFPIPL